MIPYNRKLTSTARTLRKNMTPEERHLWYDLLKRLPLTVKRQHNIQDYIVDFYIPEKKIVIEIDGIQHSVAENQEKDKERDLALSEWGIAVLRYTNKSIQNNFPQVAQDILEKLDLKISDIRPL